jgi:pimeloyl-ACP methyl ester carboxylesterase
MKIVDRGGGTPVVVIPGIQGRWEWMKPAIDALAQRCRVITFSLADEPSCGGPFDERRGFWCYVDQVRAALDAAHVRRAAICGVSYGGLIAAAFAARYPDRAASLVLVSALPPSWKPDRRVRCYVRAPRLLTPLFLLASLRLYPEIAAASGGLMRGSAAGLRHAWRVLTHMFSPRRMARRVGLLASIDFGVELAPVTQPTLLITGEASLDRVVPVHRMREYVELWPHVRIETLARTGHLGLITRPKEFARLVVSFADHAAHGADLRRRVG